MFGSQNKVVKHCIILCQSRKIVFHYKHKISEKQTMERTDLQLHADVEYH